jgi:hypothetical protein
MTSPFPLDDLPDPPDNSSPSDWVAAASDLSPELLPERCPPEFSHLEALGAIAQRPRQRLELPSFPPRPPVKWVKR